MLKKDKPPTLPGEWVMTAQGVGRVTAQDERHTLVQFPPSTRRHLIETRLLDHATDAEVFASAAWRWTVPALQVVS